MAGEDKNSYSLMNLPKPGNMNLPAFAWSLYEEAKKERDRLQLDERWRANYALFRGDHGQHSRPDTFVSVNLFFANIMRTKANVTAREPIAEARDLSGLDQHGEKMLNAKFTKWWKRENMQSKLSSTVLNNEIYGITIEKAVCDTEGKNPSSIIVDPFSFFPAPGYYEDISMDAPYIAHAYPEHCDVVESMFGLEPGTVMSDDSYSTLGRDRESSRTKIPFYKAGNAERVYGNQATNSQIVRAPGENKALVVELWVRDFRTTAIKKMVNGVVGATEFGDEIMGSVEGDETVEKYVYPDTIRVITLTNAGSLVIDDKPNPWINQEVPELASFTHAWGKLPFFKANSYEDTVSIWGFSAAEQTADLNIKVNDLLSDIYTYLRRTCFPTLIIPQDAGIERRHINNKPGLVLMPKSTVTAQGIRYLPTPNLPSNYFELLNWFIQLHDRIYQIEDADRGETPKNIVAASAIVALQERNAVLIRDKIRAIDFIVEQRAKWALSFWQNFGIDKDIVEVNGEPNEFYGIDFLGQDFTYVIESGSTMPKTSLQLQEQAVELYKLNAIDRQALLEAIDFPGWQEIIERVGEGQLGNALQILIQAGLPQEQAAGLHQLLMQNQGGPGNADRGNMQPQAAGGQPPQAGMPRGQQGQQPEPPRGM